MTSDLPSKIVTLRFIKIKNKNIKNHRSDKRKRIGELLLKQVEKLRGCAWIRAMTLNTTPFLSRAIRLY
jgi:hypothetical protein